MHFETDLLYQSVDLYLIGAHVNVFYAGYNNLILLIPIFPAFLYERILYFKSSENL